MTFSNFIMMGKNIIEKFSVLFENGGKLARW